MGDTAPVHGETIAQTNGLMDVDKEDNNQSIMEDALDVAPRKMVSLVARRDQELKVRVMPSRVRQ